MLTKRYRSFSVTLFVAVVILAGLHTQAQQTMTSANLSGHVEDDGGARIRNASVTARSISTDQEKATVSDSEGQFRLAYLMVGTYEITVWSPGFATLKRQLTLTIGQSLDVPFRLNVEGMAANIDVMTEAPVVETVRTQLSETLLPREIDSLPLNGRNYLDLAPSLRDLVVVTRLLTSDFRRLRRCRAPGSRLPVNALMPSLRQYS